MAMATQTRSPDRPATEFDGEKIHLARKSYARVMMTSTRALFSQLLSMKLAFGGKGISSIPLSIWYCHTVYLAFLISCHRKAHGFCGNL